MVLDSKRMLKLICLCAMLDNAGCKSTGIDRVSFRPDTQGGMLTPSLSKFETSLSPVVASVPPSVSNYGVADSRTSISLASAVASNPTAVEPLPSVHEANIVEINDVAELSPSSSNLLTLEATVTLALAYNPTIPQARSLVQQQNGTTVQAGLYPNPQVGYLRSDPDQPGKSRTSGAFLGQEIVTAGKLRLAQLASRYDVTLRSWQVTAQEQRVVNDVRVRFYEWVAAQEAYKVAKDLVSSANDGLRIANTMRDASIGTKPDVLQAQMQISNAEGALYDSELRIDAARQSLEAVVGTKLAACEPKAEFDEDLPDLEWESSLERLLNESPLLKSQLAELQAARAEIQLSDAQAIPNINAQMVAQRDSTEKFSSIGTFVSIPAPIFNRNQGNRISSRAFYAQQVREYERIKLALADQLSVALRQYKSLQRGRQRLQLEILPKAEENLDLVTAAYKAGRMDFQRVVDARKFLFQAKMAKIETIADLQKTFVEIDGLQLSGALNPTEVGTAFQSTATSSNGARSILSQQIQSSTNSTNRNLPGALQGGDF